MGLATHSLTLMRHAKSSWDDASLSDHDRPLNARGERDAPEMGQRLKSRGIRPSLILASTARRTTETARAVARAVGFPLEFIHRERGLYLASPDEIMATVCDQDPTFRNIIVIGHNPGMSYLANALSDDLPGDMPTAAMITLEADVDDWQGFAYAARCVVGYDYPKNAQGIITR
ncbi:MAG: histidine phosphatase family protein [Pseudomonadota bacterium]